MSLLIPNTKLCVIDWGWLRDKPAEYHLPDGLSVLVAPVAFREAATSESIDPRGAVNKLLSFCERQRHRCFLAHEYTRLLDREHDYFVYSSIDVLIDQDATNQMRSTGRSARWERVVAENQTEAKYKAVQDGWSELTQGIINEFDKARRALKAQGQTLSTATDDELDRFVRSSTTIAPLAAKIDPRYSSTSWQRAFARWPDRHIVSRMMRIMVTIHYACAVSGRNQVNDLDDREYAI